MNATQDLAPAKTASPEALASARAACSRIAPLWPLQRFVAVNPFVGLSTKTFAETCALLRRLAPGGMQMTAGYYRQLIAEGKIGRPDLEAALAREAADFPPETLLAALEEIPGDAGAPRVFTVAESIDKARGTAWEATVVDAISQFCAAYHDEGQSAWRLPWKTLPLLGAWRQNAMLDATPELHGLHGFRRRVATLSDDAPTVISQSLAILRIPPEHTADFCHKALLSVRGWAGAVQFGVRENAMRGREDNALLDLLAIRLAYEAALMERYDGAAMRRILGTDFSAEPAPEVLPLLLIQAAHEHAWERRMLASLRLPGAPASPGRAALQAVFCIDVRSEILRRSLESLSPAIQTVGFAGFFGLAIEYIPLGRHRGTSQCPVLLSPKFRVRETLRDAGPGDEQALLGKARIARRLSFSWNSFKSSAISCFSFVETAGLGFGPRLLRDAFVPRGRPALARLQTRPAARANGHLA